MANTYTYSLEENNFQPRPSKFYSRFYLNYVFYIKIYIYKYTKLQFQDVYVPSLRLFYSAHSTFF